MASSSVLVVDYIEYDLLYNLQQAHSDCRSGAPSHFTMHSHLLCEQCLQTNINILPF
jgi:hypothetical protein